MEKLTVIYPGDIYYSLSDEEKKLIGKNYLEFKPVGLGVEGLVALPVYEPNLPDDFVIGVSLDKLPEDLRIKLQGAVITYTKNEHGFYEDIFGIYEKSNGMKK